MRLETLNDPILRERHSRLVKEEMRLADMLENKEKYSDKEIADQEKKVKRLQEIIRQ